jgi:hypothetical protein
MSSFQPNGANKMQNRIDGAFSTKSRDKIIDLIN